MEFIILTYPGMMEKAKWPHLLASIMTKDVIKNGIAVKKLIISGSHSCAVATSLNTHDRRYLERREKRSEEKRREEKKRENKHH